MSFAFTIEPVTTAETPVIVMGFSNDTFSQAVFIRVDEDPLKCVEMAEALRDRFLNACAEAVKAHKEKTAS